MDQRPPFPHPNRDPTMEVLWKVDNHPQRAHIVGSTYVYLQDTSKAGLNASWELEKERKVPSGSLGQIQAAGYVQLRPGDAVFSRDKYGDGDPMNDVIQVWVTDSQTITPDMGSKLDHARDAFLGPRAKRTRDRGKPGAAHGGVAFERSAVCKPVKTDTRCYTTAASLESPRSVVAPVASAKVDDAHGPDDALEARRAVTAAAAEIARAAFSQAPQSVQDHVAMGHSLVNFPLVGVAGNVGYATTQINVAPCERTPTAGEAAPSLTGAMGFFGGAHVDSKDAPAFYSHMSAASDIPDDYEPGFFFIMQIGVFIVLDKHTSINFSGLRLHGGTPPLCPVTQTPREDAYRFVIIFYPPRRMVDGTGRISFAALPNNQAFILPPEVFHAGIKSQVERGWPAKTTCKRATFVREGILMMCRTAMFMFFVRSLLLLCHYFVLQLPEEMEAQLEGDLFIQAFTMKDEGGRRVNAGYWPLAPGVYRPSRGTWTEEPPMGEVIDRNQMRSAAFDQVYAFEAKIAKHIPYVGRRGPVRHAVPQPMSDNSDSDVTAPPYPVRPAPKPKKNKPRASKKGKAKQKDRSVSAERDASGQTTPADGRRARLEAREERRAQRERDAELAAAARSAREDWADDEGEGVESEDTQHTKRARSPSAAEGEGELASVKRLRLQVVSENAAWAQAGFHVATQQASNYVGLGVRRPLVETMASAEPPPSQERRILRPRPTDVYMRLVHDINLFTLERNIDDVQRAMDITTAATVSDMGTAYSALGLHPAAESTVAVFSTIWRGLQAMDDEAALNALRLRLDRECIMLSTHMAWTWLDGFCTSEMYKALRQKALQPATYASSSWFGRLASHCMDALRDRCPRTFNAADYGLPISAIWTGAYDRGRVYLDGVHEQVLVDDAVALARRVIASWLGFPVRGLSRLQAWFVDTVLSAMGARVLVLDEVWYAYSHLRHYILGDSQAQDHCGIVFAALHGALQSHPLAQPSSTESLKLNELTNLVAPFRDAAAPSLTHAPIAGLSFTPRSHPGHQLPSPTTASSSAQRLRTASAPDPAPSTTLDLLTPAQRIHLPEITRFVYESRDLVLGRIVGAMTPLQRFISRSMDSRSPFRELGPSRRCVNGASGPFSPEHACTASGFFSAVVFRAITFNTDFVRDPQHLSFFEDHAAFTTEVDRIAAAYEQTKGAQPPASYFCNPNAYGSCNPRRKRHLAEGYASTIFKDGESLHSVFTSRKDKSKGLAFSAAYRWLLGTYGQPGTKKKRFLQVGDLTAYLLAADYTYTGIVDPPTYEELGEIICKINKGAVRGLELLELIPRRKAGKKEKSTVAACVHGLRMVHAVLRDVLSEADQTAVGLDLIVVEHFLCKVARAYRYRKSSGFALSGRDEDWDNVADIEEDEDDE